ncbi:MAG: hypothetical protein [Circoviridae sp.]|nr:MAG: hypothetical protein [Circoviridae sp.]
MGTSRYSERWCSTKALHWVLQGTLWNCANYCRRSRYRSGRHWPALLDRQSRRLQGCSRTKHVGVITVETEATDVITAVRTTQVLEHIKRNNIAYLLGVFMMHTAGATTAALEYGQGMC